MIFLLKLGHLHIIRLCILFKPLFHVISFDTAVAGEEKRGRALPCYHSAEIGVQIPLSVHLTPDKDALLLSCADRNSPCDLH